MYVCACMHTCIKVCQFEEEEEEAIQGSLSLKVSFLFLSTCWENDSLLISAHPKSRGGWLYCSVRNGLAPQKGTILLLSVGDALGHNFSSSSSSSSSWVRTGFTCIIVCVWSILPVVLVRVEYRASSVPCIVRVRLRRINAKFFLSGVCRFFKSRFRD